MSVDERRTSSGVVMAFVSAASFALSGSFASALFDSGWSPGAAVTVRILVAAVVLAVPAAVAMRGRWKHLRRHFHLLLFFGLLAVAGAQLFYFMAVQTLSVGVALMLEYMGLVLVVVWQWITTRKTPRLTTVLGALLAIIGLVLVLDLFGNVSVDLRGVLWGLGAAFGLASYFVLAGKDNGEIPPIAMAAAGMMVGAALLGALGLVGVLRMHATTESVELAGVGVPWWTAVAGMGVISGAVAYGTGVIAARMLGAKMSAFLGLTEVLFAVVFAWTLLDQLPVPIQMLGGMLILTGITIVRREQMSDSTKAGSGGGDAPFDSVEQRSDSGVDGRKR